MGDELRALLNEAIGRELQASIQYMWQHVLVEESHPRVATELKRIAIAEMGHAEAMAERLRRLGGTPTTTPSPVKLGEDLRGMLEQDLRDEEGAIELYGEIARAAEGEGDRETAELFRRIIEDEKAHRDFFAALLECMGAG